MINEHELRIGNWFRHVYGYTDLEKKLATHDEPIMLTRGSFSSPSEGRDLFLELHPIKITASNSEGFNIAKLKNVISLLQVVQSAPLVVPQEFYLVMQIAGKAAIKIEHVHQLQNLYMDITGEYLEWNPEKQRSKLTIV